MTTLLFHSSGLSGRQWHRLGESLAEPWIAPDLSGYDNGADWHDGPAWSVDTQAMLEILDAQSGPVDLVGHSYGGSIAIQLARLRPGRVRKLVVHEPVLWGALFSDGPDHLKEPFHEFVSSGFLDLDGGGDAAWMESFVDYWNVPGAWKKMLPRHQQAFLRVGRKVFREVRDLCLDRTPASAFDDATASMLFTVGEQSPAEERAVCMILSERKSNRRVQVLPGGHMGPVADPDSFAAAAIAFLSEVE